MTIMTRFLRLVKADVHGVMDQLEDKRLLLNQYLREMETCLAQKEAHLGALADRLERLTAQSSRHDKERQALEMDLNLAIEKEKDDLARMLIRRRRILETTVCHVTEQIDTIHREQDRLSETLGHQKLQYDALKARADGWHPSPFDDPLAGSAEPSFGWRHRTAARDDEIELELLQRKTALHKGDAS